MSTTIIHESNLMLASSSAGYHGLILEEDGGIITKAKIKFGYTHRQLEACMRAVPYTMANAFAEKADFLAAPFYAFVYSAAVEAVGNIIVPPRGKKIRSILLELCRIQSHIFFLSQIARSLGLTQIHQFCLREREKYCDLFELYCGSRLGFGAILIGGVAEESTDGFLFKCEKTLRDGREFLIEIQEAFINNPILQSRLRGLAYIRKEVVMRLGITGPNARASGVFFGDFPSGSLNNGDSLSRFSQRVEEIKHSLNAVEKELNLPEGAYSVDVDDKFSPRKTNVLTNVEGPRGQINVLLFSSGNNRAEQVRLVPPSYASLRHVDDLLLGVHIDDAALIINSLDISFSEVDR